MLGAKERNASFIFARRSSNQVSSHRTSAVENMRGWVDSGPSASAPSPSLLQYADPTGEFPQCLPVFPARRRPAVRDRWSSGGPAEEKSCDRWHLWLLGSELSQHSRVISSARGQIGRA